MDQLEKHVHYSTSNTYVTLNQLTKDTKNVWLVFHGIGYLSRYFIPYFEHLPSKENYIIAPQAPSKYYLNNQYKHVGASWLTKENTAIEIQNVLSYTDAVFAMETIPLHCNLIVFGFSQGVSIAARWVAKNQLKCHHLVLYAGGIPKELTKKDFDFLEHNNTKVTSLVGDKDEYITPEILRSESKKIKVLFNGRADQHVFKGTHELKKQLISKLI